MRGRVAQLGEQTTSARTRRPALARHRRPRRGQPARGGAGDHGCWATTRLHLRRAARSRPASLIAAKAIGLYDRDELLIRKTHGRRAPGALPGGDALRAALLARRGADRRASSARTRRSASGRALPAARRSRRAVARRLVRSRRPEPERCLFIGDDDAPCRLRAQPSQHHGLDAAPVGRVPIEPDGADASTATAAVDNRRDHRSRSTTSIACVIAPGTSCRRGDLRARSAWPRRWACRSASLPRHVRGHRLARRVRRHRRHDGPRRSRRSSSARSSRVAQARDGPGRRRLALLVLSPLMAADRARDQARLARPGLLPPDARRPRRPDASGSSSSARWSTDADALKDDCVRCNEARGLFKMADDPRDHPRRALPAQDLARRAAAALQRPRRRDVASSGRARWSSTRTTTITGCDRRRLRLTPGMTGPGRSSARRGSRWSEMVKIDYLYVASWSLWSDVKILLRTVPYVLSRRGQSMAPDFSARSRSPTTTSTSAAAPSASRSSSRRSGRTRRSTRRCTGPAATFPGSGETPIRTSFLDRVPVDRGFRNLFPLYPLRSALGPVGGDVVVELVVGLGARAAHAAGDVPRVYCHTPARWLYGQSTWAPRAGSSARSARRCRHAAPLGPAAARARRPLHRQLAPTPRARIKARLRDRGARRAPAGRRRPLPADARAASGCSSSRGCCPTSASTSSSTPARRPGSARRRRRRRRA